MSPSTTAQHAAYCFAVLGAVLAATPENIEVRGPDNRIFKFPAGTPDETISCHMAKEYGISGNNCGNLTGGPKLSPMAPGAMRSNVAQKHERYSRYLRDELLRIAAFGGDAFPLMAQAELIKGNGQNDAHASRAAFGTTNYARCSTQCGSQARCLVDCIDRYDATAARVLGCQILPDGLPY